MAKKKNVTAQQRLLASAKRALAATNAKQPVARYNAKNARIEGAEKRERRKENQPPPEQEAKAVFVEGNVKDRHGIEVGRAFKRRPRFESVKELTVPQLFALRRYRRAFDASEQSPMKSALDVGVGGGGGGPWAALSRLESMAFADVELKRIEQTVPANLLPTLRRIALYDDDFATVALERFNSASGQRRDRVRHDFLAAASALAASVVQADPVPRSNAAGAPSEPPKPVPPEYLDDKGFLKPLAEIADIIRGGPAEQDQAA